MNPNHPRLPKFLPQIVQNSSRRQVSTDAQDMSQAAKRQPSGYPHTHTSHYTSSYTSTSSIPPEYDLRDGGRGTEPIGMFRQSSGQATQPLQTSPRNVRGRDSGRETEHASTLPVRQAYGQSPVTMQPQIQNARRRDDGRETVPTGALRPPFGHPPVITQPFQTPPQNAGWRDGRETEPTSALRPAFGQSAVTTQPPQIPPHQAGWRDGGRGTEPTGVFRQSFGQATQPLQTSPQNVRGRDGGRGTEPTGALRPAFGQSPATTQPPQIPPQNVRRRDGGYETESADTLTQAFGQLSVTTPKVNVILFGEQGTGKSAVINLIARKTIAPVPSGSRGFPLQSTRHDIRVDGLDFSIFETTSLDESEIGPNEYLVVLEKAHRFVHELAAAGGVHLLLFCVRGDRLTATIQSNHRLFYEVVFQSQVPLALIVTGLEGVGELEDWWARNKAKIDHYGIKSEGHACITTIPGRSHVQECNYAESNKIRELLKSCRLTASPSLPKPMDWFFCLWNGVQQFIDKNRRPSLERITNTLTTRLNLNAGTARAFLENMDRGNAYQSGRGGQGASGSWGTPAPAVRVNPRGGEGNPRSATSSNAGRSFEPHRVGSMEVAQPRTAPHAGMGGHEPSRRQMAEMTITPSPGSSRTLNSRVSMEDIRNNFPHDLTGNVTISDKYAFASGSFGDIYRGKFFLNGELIEVAIKTYKAYLQQDKHLDDMSRRFRREIAVWLKLSHPNVLQLFGTIRDPSMHPALPAMVCPWVENGTLSEYLNENKDLPVIRRLALLNDVARGLQYLHSKRVIHGDLSDSNILVQANGIACIADFGLSTLLTTMGGPSMTTSTRGTVRWMDPELLNSDNSQRSGPTTRSDIYSFGSIMFQILTGKIPYHNLSADVQVIVAMVNGTKPDRPAHGAVTNGRWNFIQACWSDGRRPSSDEIVKFTEQELRGNRAGRN